MKDKTFDESRDVINWIFSLQFQLHKLISLPPPSKRKPDLDTADGSHHSVSDSSRCSQYRAKDSLPSPSVFPGVQDPPGLAEERETILSGRINLTLMPSSQTQSVSRCNLCDNFSDCKLIPLHPPLPRAPSSRWRWNAMHFGSEETNARNVELRMTAAPGVSPDMFYLLILLALAVIHLDITSDHAEIT